MITEMPYIVSHYQDVAGWELGCSPSVSEDGVGCRGSPAVPEDGLGCRGSPAVRPVVSHQSHYHQGAACIVD